MREKKCDICGTVIPEHGAPFPRIIYTYTNDGGMLNRWTDVDFCSTCASKVIQYVNTMIIEEKEKTPMCDEPRQRNKRRFKLFKK